MKRLVLLTVFALSGCATHGDRPSADTRLVVSAAASLTPVMETLATAYTAAGGAAIELNLAGSGTLAAQILSGAPVDLFISADQRQMDRVAERQGIEADTRVDLLSNQLVVIGPLGTSLHVSSPAGLLVPEIRRIAIGEPTAVPAGAYARQYLESVGVWAALADRILPTQDVRAALATVASGDADAGVVYRTDAASSSEVTTLYEVPLPEGPSIGYPAAVVAGSAAPEEARGFLRYLRGPEAGAVFSAAGFIPSGRR